MSSSQPADTAGKTACRCEHSGHFALGGKTPNGEPSHEYGALFPSERVKSLLTTYGTFQLCENCAVDCHWEEFIRMNEGPWAWFCSLELSSYQVCEGGAIVFHFFCGCLSHTCGLDELGNYKQLFYRGCLDHEPIISAWVE